MPQYLTTADLLRWLMKRQGGKTLKQFAGEIGISAPYLYDIYNGNREPGPKLLRMLKIKRHSMYELEW